MSWAIERFVYCLPMSVDILLKVGTGTSTSTLKRVVWNLVRMNREISNIDPMLSSAVLRLEDSE
jgi:hypothetical protein